MKYKNLIFIMRPLFHFLLVQKIIGDEILGHLKSVKKEEKKKERKKKERRGERLRGDSTVALLFVFL